MEDSIVRLLDEMVTEILVCGTVHVLIVALDTDPFIEAYFQQRVQFYTTELHTTPVILRGVDLASSFRVQARIEEVADLLSKSEQTANNPNYSLEELNIAPSEGGIENDDDPFPITAEEKAAFDKELVANRAVEASQRVPSAVVVSAIAPGRYDIEEAFAAVLGQPMSLRPVPLLGPVRHRLLARYPHAAEAIGAILDDLQGQPYVCLPATLLLGPPGGGKNTLAAALAQELDLPFTSYGCAGASDAALLGCSRQWASGGPSLPLSLMLRHRMASPAILLDELEKAGTGQHNGRLLDGLLPLLEPGTAATYFDPWLQSEVNLSCVIWMAVANDIGALPPPLLDRLRILPVPLPGPEHLDALATEALYAEANRRGLSRNWVTPLDAVEHAALKGLWHGGSLRRLNRFVRIIFRARFDPQGDVHH